MPPYLRPIVVPVCYCGKKATVEVFNTFNASIGRYCGPHGRRKLAEMEERVYEAPEPDA